MPELRQTGAIIPHHARDVEAMKAGQSHACRCCSRGSSVAGPAIRRRGDALMATIEVKLLFSLKMQIEGEAEVIGAAAQGTRAIGCVSGSFEGPGLKGTIKAADWFVTRADGIGEADVRGTLRTDDGALIYMRYTGVLDLRQTGSSTTSGVCQVRTAVRFETGTPRYQELNRVQAIGIGEIDFATGQIRYDIYAL
jgi:hypothetical protein